MLSGSLIVLMGPLGEVSGRLSQMRLAECPYTIYGMPRFLIEICTLSSGDKSKYDGRLSNVMAARIPSGTTIYTASMLKGLKFSLQDL